MAAASLLEQVRTHLHGCAGIVAARVFGSVARGSTEPRDVDLAVLLDGRERSAARCSEIADLVERAIRLPVDCHDFEQLPLTIQFRVLREGVLVVDRDPARRARHEVRAMLAYYDFKPYLDTIRQATLKRLSGGSAHG